MHTIGFYQFEKPDGFLIFAAMQSKNISISYDKAFK